ncbi:MAG: Gfo/Idh/MocA family protein, partial [Alphaproteobacteria bacterium]
YAGLFEAAADALDGNPGREVTLQDGRRSVEFVTAVYASARSGIPPSLPLGKDHALYDGWLP